MGKKFDTTAYKRMLETKKIGHGLLYLKTIDSTNDYAQKLFEQGCSSALILAERQTRGRGRFGSEWISPAGGLWFTLLVEYGIEPKDLPKVTILAAYAVTKSLKRLFGIESSIKWPNDIYYGRKKLGGILTEAYRKGKRNILSLGIGLNVNLGLKELGPYSGSSTTIKEILKMDISREKLLASIVLDLEAVLGRFESEKDFAYFFKRIEKILTY